MAKRTSHRLPVADRVASKLQEIARKMGGGYVQVGFLEGATYPDGTPVAAVAFWDNFGHGGPFPAPPRPFFSNMIDENSPEWPKQMAALAKATGYDGEKVLAYMGELIEGELKKSIIDTNEPELSETTLMLRKKFGNHPEDITASDVRAAQKDVADGKTGASGTQAKPLVWTGHMLNSTGYEVKR